MLLRNLLLLSNLFTGMCISNRRVKDRFQYVFEEITEPFFTSQPQNKQAEVGKEVSFHCAVDNIGTSTLIWKKENRIISAGTTLIRKDRRFSLSGYNLTLHDVDERDKGEYVCEVETYTDPIRQTSFLDVLIPPTVVPHPEDGRYVVRKGSAITLECKAEGNPQPSITWTLKGKRTRGHEIPEIIEASSRLRGSSILLENLTRHHAGWYQCTADNGVGTPAFGRISITVLYTPELKMEKHLSADKYKIRMEIYCTVHAEPQAVVRWYKDSMLLDASENRRMESSKNRHKLMIKQLGVTDLGNYSCMAENSLGKERNYLQITGEPLQPVVMSREVSRHSEQYTLHWRTVSLLTVSEYRILFRPKLNALSTTEKAEWTNIIPTMDKQIRNTWHNSFIGVHYSDNFTFFGLEPGSQYEVMVQALNTEGWSPPSPLFQFSTPRYDLKDSIFSGSDRRCVKVLLLIVMLYISLV